MVPSYEISGYKWTRDYDSTDEENVWDRIGSIFRRNITVIQIDPEMILFLNYCIHDHRRSAV